MLWIELCFLAITIPPGIDLDIEGKLLGGTYNYTLDSVIGTITFAKAYLCLRLYKHYSKWSTTMLRKVAMSKGVKVVYKWMFKADLANRPIIFTGVILLVSIFYASFIIRTFELSFVTASGDS